MNNKNHIKKVREKIETIISKLKQDYDPDLEELLDEIIEFDASFEDFREISQKATAFYFLEPYPFFSDELSREEVKETYFESLKLIEKIENPGKYDKN